MSAASMGRAGRNATEGWGANSVETIRRQALPRTVMWPVCDQTVTVSSAASAALWTPSSLMWISCASRDVSVALVNVEEDVTHEVARTDLPQWSPRALGRKRTDWRGVQRAGRSRLLAVPPLTGGGWGLRLAVRRARRRGVGHRPSSKRCTTTAARSGRSTRPGRRARRTARSDSIPIVGIDPARGLRVSRGERAAGP